MTGGSGALRNIGVLATCRAGGAQAEIHAIAGAALAWEDGRIAWVGADTDLPERWRRGAADAGGALVIPGLVDCHTHLAFGGWRADEFEQRALGAGYLEIARGGGGIASTMRRTRALDEAALYDRAAAFAVAMRQLGVTTIECKSGYGLDVETELRLLRVYARLGGQGDARIVPTFLGAHVVPPDYRERRGEYVRLVIEEMIPAVAAAGLARCCDVFVEDSAFTLAEARRILGAGKAAGLSPKLHADQLTSGGGAELAAELGALSADHLEHASDAGIAAMSRAGVVAVSLPLATLYLRQPPMPARRFIDAGVAVAVATDFNPGSAPSYHLPLALTLACTLQRMTPAETLKGATVIAARAVGEEGECGSIEPGKSADFAIIDAPDVNTWLYHFTPNACMRTVFRGRTVWAA